MRRPGRIGGNSGVMRRVMPRAEDETTEAQRGTEKLRSLSVPLCASVVQKVQQKL